ncbi:uncharacterized protein C8A04DRAFT_12653 [Dichotomopilus funicola]|uniref:Zn(2)-C6 fungal-type domain-containing protein n=1 Tax=Dichotomopilus funicola TaxID=1934379 RepID=A0AAN6V2C8_9PEZI|nr:hypothetical protein C8A04DRAFT_12653 [Dichotomopilus funicola]
MDETDETVGSSLSGSEQRQLKTRRPHRKSRFGCTKCKARRIKCDEAMPRCSRCEKMNLSCQYRKRKDAEGWTEPPDFSWLAQTLEPADFELFKHYLEHTSKHPTVGEQDKYTLQIGIPNLACQSKPLMRSVLALAAVCKCCDMIDQPLDVYDHEARREQVAELLRLAHQYHLDSLHEIQATLHQSTNYDHILANAAMMGMYGSASHCARIWLAKTAPYGEPCGGDLAPGCPQWMSLFRAVRLAYAGLLKNSPQGSPVSSPNGLAAHSEYRAPSQTPTDDAAGPTITSHPLGPILAATVGPALTRLNEKAAEVQLLAHTNGSYTRPLQSCFEALDMLGKIVASSFPPPQSPAGSCPGTRPSTPTTDPTAMLSEISPWLRRYTASISSMVPSPMPRRTIMSFIHKVPTSFLTLVQDVIPLMPTDTEPSGGAMGAMSELTLAHHLAFEIFTHWLVLVMLLDNVWWIGGIGAWELGRAVALRKSMVEMNWQMGLSWDREGENGEWWPESMYEVGRLLEKHR